MVADVLWGDNLGAGEPQRGSLGRGEDGRCGRDPTVGVEDDADGVLPGDGTHRQLGIVGHDRAAADEDGTNRRSDPMEMGAVDLPGDELCVTIGRRDEAVLALGQLCDDLVTTGDRVVDGQRVPVRRLC